jgi:luciferase family oxidoreductase group 1
MSLLRGHDGDPVNVPGAPSFRLSVLDQSPIPEGSSGAQALRNSLDLAKHAEALGYQRYWVAEHHGAVMLAGTSPEVLIPAIASVTTSMRVGSGGVMLPHYSPLKVAENFSMLSGLFPGRVDLAVGRAAGTDPLTSYALQRDRRHAAPDDFPAQLSELLAYLENRFPPGHEFERLAMLPGRPEAPEAWLLGSSAQSGLWAAEAGLPYAFADFINPAGASVALRYRQEFVPSRARRKPWATVAASVICAESDAEAERLASSARMAFVRLLQGVLIPIPPADTAVAFLAEHASSAAALAARRRFIVGSPTTVRSGLEALAREYQADEVMIVTITHDHEARVRSYALTADAMR